MVHLHLSDDSEELVTVLLLVHERRNLLQLPIRQRYAAAHSCGVRCRHGDRPALPLCVFGELHASASWCYTASEADGRNVAQSARLRNHTHVGL